MSRTSIFSACNSPPLFPLLLTVAALTVSALFSALLPLLSFVRLLRFCFGLMGLVCLLHL